MEKALKQKWVKALRSGKFEQGKDVLHRVENGQHTFCCLGVLCEIDNIPVQNSDGMPNTNGTVRYGLEEYNSDRHYPTRQLLEKWGLSLNLSRLLAKMNDGIGVRECKSFSEIADFIESPEFDAANIIEEQEETSEEAPF